MLVKDDFHLYWMRYCLFLANKSFINNEIPVGSVIVLNNVLISEGYNKLIYNSDSTCHAEIIAIRKANKILNNYRLNNFSIYVTLEPCLMCLGAIIYNRIKNLIYGVKNNKNNVFYFLKKKKYLKKLNIYSGFLENDCLSLLKKFFNKKCRK